MKTIFTLFASLLLTVSAFAADSRSKSILSIQSSSNADIRVVLDGKRFEPNDNSVFIKGLDAGMHNIKVYREKNSGFFSISGKRYELLYNTKISVRKSTMVSISIDRNGRSSVMESNIRGGRNNNDYAYGREYDFERDGQWGDYDSNTGYARGMDQRDFARVLQTIDREWRESNKIKSATQVAQTNTLSASQVQQLVSLFGLEEYKLELAKVAYRNTVDKQNYYIVSNELTSRSRSELDRFMRTSR